MKTRLTSRKPLLWRYLGSYAAIAALSCLVISALLLILSVREMGRMKLEEQRERLAIAGEYLAGQQNVMQEVAYRIQSVNLYKPATHRGNNYREYEMVQDLARYRNYSQLASGYFLMYPQVEYVYYTAATCELRRHLQMTYGVSADAALADRLLATRKSDAVKLSSDSFIMAFELNFMGGDRAVLCFVLRASEVVGHVQAVSGLSEDDLGIRCGDTVIAESAMADDVVTIQSGLFTLTLNVTGDVPNNDSFRRFTFMSAGSLLLCMLMLLAMAMFAGYRSYLPITRLLGKYKRDDTQSGDEILWLSEMLDGMEDQTRRLSGMIDEQRGRLSEMSENLCHQAVHDVLSGDVQDVDAELVRLRIPYTNPLYAAAYVSAASGHPPLHWRTAFLRLGGDDRMVFTDALGKGDGMALLLVTAHETAMEGLRTQIRAVADSLTLEARIGSSCADLRRIGMSLLNATLSAEGGEGLSISMSSGVQQPVKRIVTQAQMGNRQAALCSLEQLNDMLSDDHVTVNMRKYVLLFAGDELLKLMGALGMNDELNRAEPLSRIVDTEMLMEALRLLIERICAHTGMRQEAHERERNHELTRWLSENACSYDLTLKAVAERFDMGEKRCAAMVRELTGMTFKEYVLQERMNAARDLLLRENMPVAQLSARVGYANVSYFIMLFREQFGCTPAKYRLLLDTKNEE